MASVQQAQGVAQINHEKEKAILSGLVKEAQPLLETNRGLVQPQFATVGGIMKNSQERTLKLEKIHDGFGRFLVKPSDQIGKEVVGTYVHTAQAFPMPPDGSGGIGPVVVGSKAAVIYGTYDKMAPQLGYLLAWYKDQNSSAIKVYVRAGHLSELMKLEWNEIEQKLDASGTESKYLDRETGAFAAAEIKDFEVGGKLAGVGANFDRINILN